MVPLLVKAPLTVPLQHVSMSKKSLPLPPVMSSLSSINGDGDVGAANNSTING